MPGAAVQTPESAYTDLTGQVCERVYASGPVADTLFFFNGPATTEIYTLSLHDALPICYVPATLPSGAIALGSYFAIFGKNLRSEEHTSELQSRGHLVCRLLLEKKKKSQGPERGTRLPRPHRRQRPLHRPGGDPD